MDKKQSAVDFFQEEIIKILKENNNSKIAISLDNIKHFKFPLAKNMLHIMHNFDHPDYNKFIGLNNENSLSLNNNTSDRNIL